MANMPLNFIEYINRKRVKALPNKRFHKPLEGCVVPTNHIAVGLDKQTIYVETVVGGRVQAREEVSNSYKRSVVHFASEENIFEIDGMKFKVTCERI